MSHNEPTRDRVQPEPTSEEVAAALRVLEQLADDRGLLASLPDEQRHRLLRAASTVSFPGRKARRQLTRSLRRRRQQEVQTLKEADEALLEQTGIRSQFLEANRPRLSTRQIKRVNPPAPFDTELPPSGDHPAENFGARLNVPRNCYICKRPFKQLHKFYDSMCPDCAEFNWKKRHQTADLSGRYALLTGGRVKIGFQGALKLLRAGAHVIVTTRFPRDGAGRFLAEADSSDWMDRVDIHGLDLRHAPSVEAFADHLVRTLPRLDFILNNACQTVRRPPGFYQHLMDGERQMAVTLPAEAQPLLESYESLRSQIGSPVVAARDLPEEVAGSLVGIHRAAELSQIPLVDGDTENSNAIFPRGQYDVDQQQLDLRDVNSWRLTLAEVSTVELLEVHLVNAVAPFILNARLKPLMQQVHSTDKHIVNVSAMEGIFYRAFKTDKHPHTNMAKAGLNMMTRTSAQDYVKHGIHMNSVDTGWITDEDPAEITQRKREELGFHTPLDLVDAAARICDPIFTGFLTGEHMWGKFLKDYQVANW